MKGIQFNFAVAFATIGFLFFLLPPDAIAENHTCYITSTDPNFFFNVYDVMPAGNRVNHIWRGKIKEGQRALIKTRYGRFYYDYIVDTDSQTAPLSGVVLLCNNGELISVP